MPATRTPADLTADIHVAHQRSTSRRRRRLALLWLSAVVVALVVLAVVAYAWVTFGVPMATASLALIVGLAALMGRGE